MNLNNMKMEKIPLHKFEACANNGKVGHMPTI